jgi:hypothetical protein
MSMSLCDRWGMPLFKACPDIFPQGFLTEKEILLWVNYYEDKKVKNGRRR